MKSTILILMLFFVGMFNAFSQTYWTKQKIIDTKKELTLSLVKNKIQFNNTDQKEEFLNCFVSKLMNGFPNGNYDNSEKEMALIKSYQADCLKSTFAINDQSNIKNAKLELGWSEVSMVAFQNQIFKQLQITGKFNDTDSQIISKCVAEKTKDKYPEGINFSKIDLNEYHSNLLQYVKECIAKVK